MWRPTGTLNGLPFLPLHEFPLQNARRNLAPGFASGASPFAKYVLRFKHYRKQRSLSPPIPRVTASDNHAEKPPATVAEDDVSSAYTQKRPRSRKMTEDEGNKTVARVLVLLVPLFWGTYGPAIRYVYEQPDPTSPSILTLVRKGVSLFFFLCFLPLESSIASVRQEPADRPTDVDKPEHQNQQGCDQLFPLLRNIDPAWIGAVELGLWTFLGTAFQTAALETTTAARAGFLIQTVTVIVPALCALSGFKVPVTTWVAAVLALLGVILLSVQQHDYDGNVTASTSAASLLSDLNLSQGDLQVLCAALFYAVCTVRLSRYAAMSRALQLSTNVMVVSTTFAASWVLFEYFNGGDPHVNWTTSSKTLFPIIFSAFVPGTLASLCQTIGQRHISASEAQVYYSMQSFWSAVFSVVLLNEDIDPTTWIAGFLLLLAAFVVSFEGVFSENI